LFLAASLSVSAFSWPMGRSRHDVPLISSPPTVARRRAITTSTATTRLRSRSCFLCIPSCRLYSSLVSSFVEKDIPHPFVRILKEDQDDEEEKKNDTGNDGYKKIYTAKAFAESCSCDGYLLYQSGIRHDDDNDIDVVLFEAHITCPEEMGTITSTTVATATITALIHKLLLHAMTLLNENGQGGKDVSIHIHGCDIDIQEEIQKMLFWGRTCDIGKGEEDKNGSLVFSFQRHLPMFISHLNQYAFQRRGTEQGHVALQLLQVLGKRRVTYQFQHGHNGGGHGHGTKEVVSLKKQVLSFDTVEKIMEYVTLIRRRQWLSTNPDSVDGLPSLHLNLISNGRPLFECYVNGDGGEVSDEDKNKDGDVSFERCISEMVDFLHSPLYDTLLPAVRQLTNSTTLEISDVFIRNYGVMDAGIVEIELNEQNGAVDDSSNANEMPSSSPPPRSAQTRYGLSPHYDITAFATCVMALDNTASTGKNGLYTIRKSSEMGVSNHAALREFFPLEMGDGVVHTFDVLHGVDVDPNLNQSRTSLIVWFTDLGDNVLVDETMGRSKTGSCHPSWLWNPSNHVEEFVLALATECKEDEKEEDGSQDHHQRNPLNLYISSASKGNIFSITHLGQLCDDDKVDHSQFKKILSFLKDFDPSNPFLPRENDCEVVNSKTLAAALWYHAGIMGGNRVAQVSLADELMLHFMSQKNIEPLDSDNDDDNNHRQQQQDEDMILMASTLFTMAMFQGHDSSNSLMQLMDVNCQRLSDNGVEIPSEHFFEDSVVKTLMLSL